MVKSIDLKDYSGWVADALINGTAFKVLDCNSERVLVEID